MAVVREQESAKAIVPGATSRKTNPDGLTTREGLNLARQDSGLKGRSLDLPLTARKSEKTLRDVRRVRHSQRSLECVYTGGGFPTFRKINRNLVAQVI